MAKQGILSAAKAVVRTDFELFYSISYIFSK